jgi:hypothetical protein
MEMSPRAYHLNSKSLARAWEKHQFGCSEKSCGRAGDVRLRLVPGITNKLVMRLGILLEDRVGVNDLGTIIISTPSFIIESAYWATDTWSILPREKVL